MEQRLLLAFCADGIGAVPHALFLQSAAAVQDRRAGQSQTAPVSAPAVSKTADAAPAVLAAPVPGQIVATSEQQFVVDTDIYRVTLSNRGGTVRSWILKKYRDKQGKPLELINEASYSKVAPPFSVVLRDDKAADALNYGLYAAKPAANGLGIEYEFSDGKNYAKKTFQFSNSGGAHAFLSQIETEVTINGMPTDHLIQWRGGFGDATVLNRTAEQHVVYFDPHEAAMLGFGQGKLTNKDAKSVKDRPVITSGDYSFAGLDDRFFAAVFLPKTTRKSRWKRSRTMCRPRPPARRKCASAWNWAAIP